MSKILELRSITAGYGNEMVLHDVSLTVGEHDFIGIIGPNGGGKTTLLKVMMGLIVPIRGTVEIFTKKNGRSIFGYLPQVNQIDGKFPISVRDVVLSGLMRQRQLTGNPGAVEKSRATELLEKAGVASLKNKVIGSLSGGQLQRVLLARAVISRPHILVLDEPNTFVDNNFEQDLYGFLKLLNEEMAIILVSHDLGMVSSHVKTIACVNRVLHYHPSSTISDELLEAYHCPIELIAHGDLPHRILKEHDHE